MTRNRNTDIGGKPFAQTTVGDVWRKGKVIPNYDPCEWRRDMCGRTIRFGDYGKTTSEYGWEVDHIVPVAKGGGDQLSNLQPLQWENNRMKGDMHPWFCR